jgi:hypothetical protein
LRKLTKEQHAKITEAVVTDGVFHAVEQVIDAILEELDLELDESEWIQWEVKIHKEIGDDDDWEADGRGPEPLLDKP